MSEKKRNIKRKNHYIPVFYQKRFLLNDGDFFRYDIKYDNIKKCSPDSLFFEKDLYTSTNYSGCESDTIEEIYSLEDSLFSKNYDNMINRKDLSVSECMDLISFACNIYWRNPNKQSEVISFFKTCNWDKIGYSIHKNNGKQLPKEDLLDLKKSKAFQYFNAIVAQIAPIRKNPQIISNVHIFTVQRENLIISDNPVIFHHKKFSIGEFSPFIFDLSSCQTLFCMEGINSCSLTKKYLFHKELFLLANSERYFACSNYNYLVDKVDFYRREKESLQQFKENLRKELFCKEYAI